MKANADRLRHWTARLSLGLAAFALVIATVGVSSASTPTATQATQDSTPNADTPSTMVDSSHEVVRVGFMEFDGYHMIDSAGDKSGYGYDLLKMMLPYENWEYEYIGYDKSWNDMLAMLDSGEIDLLTSASMTDERLQKYDYSSKSIGVNSTRICVASGNNDYSTSDYSNWSGVRVGLLAGNSKNANFDDYATQHGFTYEAVDYFSND